MSEAMKIAFASIAPPKAGALVIFVGADLKPGARTAALIGAAGAGLPSAAETMGFKGKEKSSLDILQPAGLAASRLLIVGVAPGKDGKALDFTTFGGFVAGKLGKAKAATVIFELPGAAWDAAAAAEFALGAAPARLSLREIQVQEARSEENDPDPVSLTIGLADAAAARAAYRAREAVAEGVEIARTLVNEPPNVLYPESSPSAPRICASSASRSKSSTKR